MDVKELCYIKGLEVVAQYAGFHFHAKCYIISYMLITFTSVIKIQKMWHIWPWTKPSPVPICHLDGQAELALVLVEYQNANDPCS